MEDNPDLRAYMREIFVGHYRIVEAADGQDGLYLGIYPQHPYLPRRRAVQRLADVAARAVQRSAQ